MAPRNRPSRSRGGRFDALLFSALIFSYQRTQKGDVAVLPAELLLADVNVPIVIAEAEKSVFAITAAACIDG
jgi:hypothetical protein